jgi:hypothetical protein
MGMCKKCGEVFNSTEMIDGYCKGCLEKVENEELTLNLKLKTYEKSGMMGGVTFYIEAKLEVDNDVMHDIEKYKIGKETIFEDEVKIPMTNLSFSINLNIDDLIYGITFNSKEVLEIPYYREAFIDASTKAKARLEFIRNFEGEETIEI